MENKTIYENPQEFYLKGGDRGILLIHGFTGSNTDLRGIAEFLYQKGFSVFAVCLAGHGTSEYDLEKTKLEDWEQSVQEGYNKLKVDCPTISVIGFSMGSLLGLRLSMKNPVKALVAVSPALLKKQLIISFIPVIRIFKRWHTIKGGSDATNIKPPYKIVSYEKAPVIAIRELFKLIAIIRKSAITIKTPILILQGKKDGIIPLDAGKELYSLVSSKDKEVVFLEKSGHSILVEDEREIAWDLIYNFINKHMPSSQI